MDCSRLLYVGFSSMHKFFVDKKNISDNIALITGGDVKHIYKVLRLKPGDNIIINDLNGEEYLGEISEIIKECVKVVIREKLDVNNEPSVKIHLFQGVPKSSKMDFIIQKCCEVGVNEFTPIQTKRTELDLKDIKKIDRWQRIALESSKQSKRSLIPKVNEAISFSIFLKQLANFSMIIVPYEEENSFGIKELLRGSYHASIALVIGPEGGFESEEIESLREIGANIVTLGKRILRTETAGMIASAFILYELSDMGGVYE